MDWTGLEGKRGITDDTQIFSLATGYMRVSFIEMRTPEGRGALQGRVGR